MSTPFHDEIEIAVNQQGLGPAPSTTKTGKPAFKFTSKDGKIYNITAENLKAVTLVIGKRYLVEGNALPLSGGNETRWINEITPIHQVAVQQTQQTQQKPKTDLPPLRPEAIGNIMNNAAILATGQGPATFDEMNVRVGKWIDKIRKFQEEQVWEYEDIPF